MNFQYHSVKFPLKVQYFLTESLPSTGHCCMYATNYFNLAELQEKMKITKIKSLVMKNSP